MTALKDLEKRTYRNGALIKFQDVDYNILTFKEQMMTDLGTSLLDYSTDVYVCVE